MFGQLLKKFVLLHRLAEYIRFRHDDLRAKISKSLATREIIKQLEIVHAQEIVNYAGNEWAMCKRAQAAEIRAVREGKIDIIDRRSWAFPYLPEALHRLNQPILKNTPYNLRRFSETPIPRRAINLIKNAMLSFDWEIKPTKEQTQIDPDMQQRIDIVTESLKRPNNCDSFRDLMEPVIEDILIGGYGTIEPRLTPYYQRPFKLWAVDGSTIRIFMDWTESTPDRPHYAQMTGLKGERGIVTFLDDELIYIRDNVRSSTPFGLGRLEVSFNAVNAFLGVQEMASKAGSDQIHKNWLWWEQPVTPAHFQTIRRHILNEHEGQQRISLMAGVKKPEILDVKSVLPEDLLLEWQKFLINVIANGFDMSPMALGETDKVNKATGQVMADSDFRSSVLPMAYRVENVITDRLIHRYLGWKDIEFSWIGLEDPDILTRTMIQFRNYMMNALTPDDIRKDMGRPPLPGGWGKLTMLQMQILAAEATAKMTGKAMGAGGAMGSRMGLSSGGGGGMGGGQNMGVGGSMGSGGMGMGMSSSMFSAADFQSMTPEEFQLYQELGILPKGSQLMDQMQQTQPGILDQLTDEVREFLQKQQEEEQMDEVQPAPITPKQQQEQILRWEEGMHQESIAEATINRRRAFGEPAEEKSSKNAQRGKYRKNALGRYAESYYPDEGNKNDKVPERPLKGQMPSPKRFSKDFQPGRKNGYK